MTKKWPNIAYIIFSIFPIGAIQEKKFNGAVDVAKHLIKTRGFVGGMYCGYFGMQVRQILFTGGTFLTIDMIKDGLRSGGVEPLPARLELVGFYRILGKSQKSMLLSLKLFRDNILERVRDNIS